MRLQPETGNRSLRCAEDVKGAEAIKFIHGCVSLKDTNSLKMKTTRHVACATEIVAEFPITDHVLIR